MFLSPAVTAEKRYAQRKRARVPRDFSLANECGWGNNAHGGTIFCFVFGHSVGTRSLEPCISVPAVPAVPACLRTSAGGAER